MRERLILISTTDLASGRDSEVERMLASVERFRQDNPSCVVRHLFLFQNAAGRTVPVLPDWVEVQECDTLISLSAARNRLLAGLEFSEHDQATVIAFPDDDAWFPDRSLDQMRRIIAESPTVDFAFCRSGEDAVSPSVGITAEAASLDQAIRLSSSNTIFFRASLIAKLGLFDEELGLGTPMGGGEDTDYAIRAWHAARASVFVDAKLVGHRDNSPFFRYKYYKGSLAAIARNRMASPGAAFAFVRKLGVGAVYWVQRKISAREVFSAFA